MGLKARQRQLKADRGQKRASPQPGTEEVECEEKEGPSVRCLPRPCYGCSLGLSPWTPVAASAHSQTLLWLQPAASPLEPCGRTSYSLQRKGGQAVSWEESVLGPDLDSTEEKGGAEF